MTGHKIEIREEMDEDFGPCLRVFIDGYPRQPFVKRNLQNAEVELLKHTLADLYWESHRNDKELEELKTFKSTFRKLCSMAGFR